MSESSPQSFLNLLGKSGLIPQTRLRDELLSLRESLQTPDVSVDVLTQYLLDKGWVTQWHVDKLLTGKYRGFFLGKYKLLGLLGTGGMSSVYLAEHRLSGQQRAIKVLPRKKVADKSYLDRFYLEAKAAASLNHPNVVRIYDICNEGDTHYMVMEYVQGKDLSELIKARGPLPFQEAVDYCIQAADGLTHAHNRDLVHRDIKPANLILTDDGTIKILDLGLALMFQEDAASLTLLYNEKVMGTADYLAPEQAVNSHLVDRRADIYSLGCTLYFLLAGHPPFPKGTIAQRIAMHQTQEPADLRQSRDDCPSALVAICKQMMMKQAELRYQNCHDLKTELQGWLKTGKQLGTGLLPGSLVSSQPELTAPLHNTPITPIVIDTSGSSKSDRPGSGKGKGGLSGKKLAVESVKRSRPASSKKLRSPAYARSTPPKWLMPVLILIMFMILLAVLYFVSRSLNPGDPVQAYRMDKQPATSFCT